MTSLFAIQAVHPNRASASGLGWIEFYSRYAMDTATGLVVLFKLVGLPPLVVTSLRR